MGGALAGIAVFVGAGSGALLRWRFNVWFNPLLPTMPLGTLAANLTGGLLIGLFSAWFARHAEWPPEWRLFVITGFLGGLTTFSSYSAEVVGLAAEGRSGWALATAAAHLVGSLGLTAAGVWLVNVLVPRGVPG